MAEVLITLGIIGVVAALTIPTLISNYQKKSYVTALQKTYATLQNGFKLMAATEGVDYLSQTQFAKDYDCSNSEETERDAIYNNLSKYFRIADVGRVGAEGKLRVIQYICLNGEEDEIFEGYNYIQLQDGSILYIYSFNPDELELQLDLNGVSEPNQLGRDLFRVVLKDITINGNTGMQFMPFSQYNNMDGDKIIPYSKYDGKLCGEIGSTDVSEADGSDCLDRIIEEGWKMNY